jgi:hypothetical protein
MKQRRHGKAMPAGWTRRYGESLPVCPDSYRDSRTGRLGKVVPARPAGDRDGAAVHHLVNRWSIRAGNSSRMG